MPGNAGILRRPSPRIHGAASLHDADEASTDGSSFQVHPGAPSGRASSVGASSAWSASVNRMQTEQQLTELRRQLEHEQTRSAALQHDCDEMQSQFGSRLRALEIQHSQEQERSRTERASLQRELESARDQGAAAATASRESAQELRQVVAEREQLLRDAELMNSRIKELAASESELISHLTAVRKELADTKQQVADMSEAHNHRAALVRELLASLRSAESSIGVANLAAGVVLSTSEGAMGASSLDLQDQNTVEF